MQNKQTKTMSGTSVFVRGFDFTTTQEQVEAHCSSCGTVQSVELMRGNAIVTFATAEEATYAIEQLNQSVIAGNSRYIDVLPGDSAPAAGASKGGGKGAMMQKMMSAMMGGMMNGCAAGGVKRAWDASPWGFDGQAKKPRGGNKEDDPAGSGRVFVRGFDFGTTDAQFEGHMGYVGEIHSVHWVTKGSAVVVYKTAASAARAANELNGTIIEGNTRYMDVLLKTS